MNSLARGFFTFGSLTLVSRIAGFVRDMLTAAMLGAGPVADAYVVAQRLPNLFRSLFAEGAFSAAFVPLFTKHRHEQGDADARKFAEETQSVLALLLLGFTGLMMLGMPWVIAIIAPGFSGEHERYVLAVSFGYITFPYLFLISLTALQGGVLNAIGRIGPFAAAPIILNLVQIVALLFVVPLTGKPGYVLSWGMTIGGFLQFSWLAWHCRRAGVKLGWRRPRLTPEVRQFLRKLGPGIIGASAAQFNLAVSTMLSSLLPAGSVAYLFYADRLNQLPLGVIGIALSTALLPLLSHAVHTGDKTNVKYTTSRAVDLALMFGLPSMVGLIAIGTPIMQVLFARGAFTPEDAAATAEVLAAYATGIPAFMLVKIFAARFFAEGDTRTPVRVALLAVATNVALSVWLLRPFGGVGIAFATSCATWVNLSFLVWRLHQRDGALLDNLSKRRIWLLVLCALVMGACAYGAAHVLSFYLYGAHLLIEITALAAVLAVGAASYGAMLQVTKAIDFKATLALLKRKPA